MNVLVINAIAALEGEIRIVKRHQSIRKGRDRWDVDGGRSIYDRISYIESRRLLVFLLKGIVSRDFLTLVFFIKHLLLGHWFIT
jgi:hypothetical protein